MLALISSKYQCLTALLSEVEDVEKRLSFAFSQTRENCMPKNQCASRDEVLLCAIFIN